MSFFTRFNPAGGIADFWHEFRRPNPYRWPILIISCLLTGIMIWSFTRERVYLPPDLPKVTFINTFPEGRSIDEIRASNIENQRRKEKLEAEQAARDEAARDAYRALGRASGMDVDAIDRNSAQLVPDSDPGVKHRAVRIELPDARDGEHIDVVLAVDGNV